MKKKSIFLFLVFSFMILINVNDVKADCYRKCEGSDCEFVSTCTSSSSISCEIYADSYCDLGVQIKKVSCGTGEGKVTGIPKKIPGLTSLAVNIIQIAVPIILVIMGSIDLFKGITAGKEDEMKKGQQIFIKRLVLGAIIFFVVVIVKFLISIVADTNVSNIVDCIDCFVSNDCEV